MFNRTITYEVVTSNEELEVMEVEFRSEGLKPVLVGMPYPFEGVSLERQVAAHTPYLAFQEQLPRQVIKVGDHGVIAPIPERF